MASYKRPSFNDVMSAVAALPTVPQQINYLRQVLLEDDQSLDFEDVGDHEAIFFSGGDTAQVLPMSGHDPDHEEERRRYNDERSIFRRKVQREVDYRLNLLSDPQVEDNAAVIKAIDRIRWLGSTTALVYLYDKLLQERLIAGNKHSRDWSLLSAHFSDKDGNDIENLKQAYQNMANTNTGKPRTGSDEIDNTVKEAKRLSEAEDGES